MFFYGPVQRHHRALHIFRNLPGNGLVRVTRHHHRALRLCRYLRGNHIMALRLHRTRGMLPKNPPALYMTQLQKLDLWNLKSVMPKKVTVAPVGQRHPHQL